MASKGIRFSVKPRHKRSKGHKKGRNRKKSSSRRREPSEIASSTLFPNGDSKNSRETSPLQKRITQNQLGTKGNISSGNLDGVGRFRCIESSQDQGFNSNFQIIVEHSSPGKHVRKSKSSLADFRPSFTDFKDEFHSKGKHLQEMLPSTLISNLVNNHGEITPKLTPFKKEKFNYDELENLTIESDEEEKESVTSFAFLRCKNTEIKDSTGKEKKQCLKDKYEKILSRHNSSKPKLFANKLDKDNHGIDTTLFKTDGLSTLNRASSATPAFFFCAKKIEISRLPGSKMCVKDNADEIDQCLYPPKSPANATPVKRKRKYKKTVFDGNKSKQLLEAENKKMKDEKADGIKKMVTNSVYFESKIQVENLFQNFPRKAAKRKLQRKKFMKKSSILKIGSSRYNSSSLGRRRKSLKTLNEWGSGSQRKKKKSVQFKKYNTIMKFNPRLSLDCLKNKIESGGKKKTKLRFKSKKKR